MGVVAFRVNDAHLIRLLQQSFYDARRQRSLPASRRTSEEDIHAIGLEEDLGIGIGACAEEDMVSLQAGLQIGQIGGHDAVNELADPGPVIVWGGPIRT